MSNHVSFGDAYLLRETRVHEVRFPLAYNAAPGQTMLRALCYVSLSAWFGIAALQPAEKRHGRTRLGATNTKGTARQPPS
jgi:hypothetical protein